jgi:CheY-like chemotaxis protein
VKILILDDDKICRRVNSESLRRAGYDTIEASSVKEGFELLEQGEPVVLVIADMMMPDTSGLEFLARLRSEPQTAELPVMFCTCVPTREWLTKAQALGISGYCQKPVNANQFRGKVAMALQDEPWPLQEISRSLARLDITAEAYFECLDDLSEQLTEFISQANDSEKPMTASRLVVELSGLRGAAENLGAQRIADSLANEIDVAKQQPEEGKTKLSSAILRETAMLKLASSVLRREQEEMMDARREGRNHIRSSNLSRWQSNPIVKPVAAGNSATADAPSKEPAAEESGTSQETSAAPENAEAQDAPAVQDTSPSAQEGETAVEAAASADTPKST